MQPKANGCVKLSWQKPVSYSESYETGIPIDWIIKNYGSDTAGESWSSSVTYVHDGTKSVCCHFGGDQEISNEWLITNRVAITENAYVLKFWHMASFPEDDNMPNYIRVSSGMTDTADFATVWTFPGEPLSLPGWWTRCGRSFVISTNSFILLFNFRAAMAKTGILIR
jgi:hypothetical protein